MLNLFLFVAKLITLLIVVLGKAQKLLDEITCNGFVYLMLLKVYFYWKYHVTIFIFFSKYKLKIFTVFIKCEPVSLKSSTKCLKFT